MDKNREDTNDASEQKAGSNITPEQEELLDALGRNERYPIVEIGGKRLRLVQLPEDGPLSLAGMELPFYENTTYIRGEAVPFVLEELGLKMFTTMDQAEQFIDTHLPGETRAEKVRHLANLLGLKKSGYISHREAALHKAGTFGYATLCAENMMEACDIWYSDTDADIGYYSLDNAQPIIAREE